MDSKYLMEALRLNESSIQYEEKVIDCPKNIELKDGEIFTAPLGSSFDKVYPHKIIIQPFETYDDAVQYCYQYNIPISFIQETPDVFIKYIEYYRIYHIGCTVNCEINQYKGRVIQNTYKNFPLEVKKLVVYYDTLTQDIPSNTDIILAAKEKYKSIKWPSNVGVSSGSRKYIEDIFEIKFDKISEE